LTSAKNVKWHGFLSNNQKHWELLYNAAEYKRRYTQCHTHHIHPRHPHQLIEEFSEATLVSDHIEMIHHPSATITHNTQSIPHPHDTRFQTYIYKKSFHLLCCCVDFHVVHTYIEKHSTQQPNHTNFCIRSSRILSIDQTKAAAAAGG
jgi:hypothetical protein